MLKIKEGLGGRIRLMLSGAAPLPRHIEEFMRVTGCSVLAQGYGETVRIVMTTMRIITRTLDFTSLVIWSCLQSSVQKNHSNLILNYLHNSSYCSNEKSQCSTGMQGSLRVVQDALRRSPMFSR